MKNIFFYDEQASGLVFLRQNVFLLRD